MDVVTFRSTIALLKFLFTYLSISLLFSLLKLVHLLILSHFGMTIFHKIKRSDPNF